VCARPPAVPFYLAEFVDFTRGFGGFLCVSLRRAILQTPVPILSASFGAPVNTLVFGGPENRLQKQTQKWEPESG
jgi:hypothetical protein